MSAAHRPSSTTLLALCFLAIGTPAQAAPGGPGPAMPRCTPEQPQDGLRVGDWVSRALPSPAVKAVASKAHHGMWAVGEGGYIAFLPWKGAQWTLQDSGTAHHLHLLLEQHGGVAWAGGAAHTLLKFSRGVWQPVSVPGSGDITAIEAYGANLTLVGDASGSWHLSDDYGASWTSHQAPGGSAITAAVAGPAPILGRADGSVVVMKHDNGQPVVGSSTMVSPGKSITSLLQVNLLTLLAIDEQGTLFQTTDAGQNWSKLKSEVGLAAGFEKTPVGAVLVGRSGALVVVSLSPEGLKQDPSYASIQSYGVATEHRALPAAPAQVEVVQTAASTAGLQLRTAQGTVLQLPMEPWSVPLQPCGRPLEIHGSARVAAPATGPGWAAAFPQAEQLSSDARAALAAAWLMDAKAEHASVASFARFVLRLMALGAPVELVRDAQEAMADELRHAEHCYGLASRYAGELLAPGALTIDGALDGAADLASVAVEVLREGAIGETLGAALAAAMRDGAEDTEVKQVLTGIAQDEASHAQAGWRFLAWAVEQGGETVRQALRSAVPEALAEHRAMALRVVAPQVAGWQAHGRLSTEQHRSVVQRTLAEVVSPCVERLLSAAAR